jgi:DNA end-binding protein Ku
MVNPDTGEVVPHEEIRRAYVAANGDRVILEPAELATLEPEPSREIRLVAFLPPGEIAHRWYERPYYLGPDGSSSAYFALTEAVSASGLEGLAQWVMRGKEYVGALRLYKGYLMLMSMRRAGEVVAVEGLKAPGGSPLNPKELAMARQLVGLLESEFDLSSYQDAYRARVLELVQAKAKGARLKLVKPSRKQPSDDLHDALQASLQAMRKSA